MGPVFQAVLESRRDAFNARFAAARRASRTLEGEVVLAWLGETLAPIVEAVGQIAPDRAEPVAERLYAVGLDLLSRDLLGPAARRGALNEGWKLLPALAGRLSQEPERLARALSNAWLALEQGGRADGWTLRLLELDPLCDGLDELLEAGKVLAWRCGLARYRESALDVAVSLKPALIAAIFDVPVADEAARAALLARLLADPWADPAGARVTPLRVVARVGAFRGLGGPFLRPPRVALVEGRLLASDGDETVSLHADRFGAQWLRTSQPLPADPPNPGLRGALSRMLGRSAASWDVPGGQVSWSEDGTLFWVGRSARFPRRTRRCSRARESSFECRSRRATANGC
jgi:hypothetical protein